MGSDAEAKARGRWRGLLAPAILLVVYALWLAQHYRGRTRSRRRRGHPDNIFGSAFDREAFARADRDASAAIDADELAEAPRRRRVGGPVRGGAAVLDRPRFGTHVLGLTTATPCGDRLAATPRRWIDRGLEITSWAGPQRRLWGPARGNAAALDRPRFGTHALGWTAGDAVSARCDAAALDRPRFDLAATPCGAKGPGRGDAAAVRDGSSAAALRRIVRPSAGAQGAQPAPRGARDPASLLGLRPGRRSALGRDGDKEACRARVQAAARRGGRRRRRGSRDGPRARGVLDVCGVARAPLRAACLTTRCSRLLGISTRRAVGVLGARGDSVSSETELILDNSQPPGQKSGATRGVPRTARGTPQGLDNSAESYSK